MEVVKAYGAWTGFMQSFGLKPWEQSDAEEGHQIARQFALNDEQDKKDGERKA